MRDIGMLFQAEMVRATLERIKGETRRMKGLKEINKNPDAWRFFGFEEIKGVLYATFDHVTEVKQKVIRCPYGTPGDNMWVRETFAEWLVDDADNATEIPGGISFDLNIKCAYRATGDAKPNYCKWEPSIHMPRDAARIVTPILEIGLERLHDITEEGAKNEGVKLIGYLDAEGKPHGLIPLMDEKGKALPYIPKSCTFREFFIKLWCEINGKAAWDANPWVWVVKYKKLEAK